MDGEEHQATQEDQEDKIIERGPGSLIADTVERASAQAGLQAALGDERSPPPRKPGIPLAPGAWAQSACDDPNCRLGFSHEHLLD